MKFKCVIFDLDGTLVDTLEDIALSMNRALEAAGFPALAVEQYAGIVGNGIGRLAALALPEDRRNVANAGAIAAEAARFYAEKPLVHSRPYPGIRELLAALQELKVKTAVLSNKPDPVARMVIGGLFPPGSFDLVQGEIPGTPRKPDPAAAWEIMLNLGVTPRETVFAGDSEVDIQTALAAECSVLAVSWGYRSREILEQAGAARVIDTPEELLELVRETRY
jgi:phosphoglycolate phosphatase